jgi:ribosome-associated translation inhibitor RaiA
MARRRSEAGEEEIAMTLDYDALTPETVELHAPDDLPDETATAVRERMASLQRYTDEPLLSARLTLRRPQTHASRARWVADASILLDGRPLAAHATGPSATAATDEVVERLRRQIRRVAGKEIATRNEPRTIARALRDLRNERGHRPSAEVLPTTSGDRRLVHRIALPPVPVSLADAAADLVDRDWEFRLFLEQDTGQWLFLHRRDDDRLGLMHPPWVPVPEVVEDVMVVEPMRFSDPLTLDEAQDALEQLGERYLYFVDAADERPKVLYLRHDGDLGLIEPEHEVAVDPL